VRMATTKKWTLDEVHSLPDDGNKYELVRGELFVTPPPSDQHETILARLSRLLDPYVAAQGLGLVYHPRSVLRFEGSEVEPDLMVRQASRQKKTSWDHAPRPVLIVEVFSDSTRRRDQLQKRRLYMDAGILEYWMVDPERETITVVRPGVGDQTLRHELVWEPRAGVPPLVVRLADIFER
jgi:Uma2 family endonuclease